MILFLDFDGVLHPDEAYQYKGRGIVLKTANLPDEYAEAELFCFMPYLEQVLKDFSETKIVLSTSWVKVVGYSRAVARLSPDLRRRVIGATYHSLHTPDWNDKPRYCQIAEHVERERLGNAWIAIDDDDEEWPDAMRKHLVLTDRIEGLSVLASMTELRDKLKRLENRFR